MVTERFMIPGPKGRLQAILHLPDGFDRTRDRCPVVIMLHGIMPNPVTIPLPHFARTLARNGYAALRFYFYGNMGSDGTSEEVTVPGEIEDARTVYRLVRSWPFASRVVLLGHSQGGVVASMLAGLLQQDAGQPAAPPDGEGSAGSSDEGAAGLSDETVVRPSDTVSPDRELEGKLGEDLLPPLSDEGAARLSDDTVVRPSDTVSPDQELEGKLGEDLLPPPDALILLSPGAVLKDYAQRGRLFGLKIDPADPPERKRVLWYTIGREYILTAQTLPIYETSARYTGPVCICHGTVDRIVPYRYSQRYADGYADCRLLPIPGANHFYSFRRRRVDALLLDFLRTRL